MQFEGNEMRLESYDIDNAYETLIAVMNDFDLSDIKESHKEAVEEKEPWDKVKSVMIRVVEDMELDWDCIILVGFHMRDGGETLYIKDPRLKKK